MKRKIFFLSSEKYFKDVVDNINEYFDKGYEIERILDSNCGYYIILILKGNENYLYKKKYDLHDYNIIEEKNNLDQKWFKTTTKDINFIYS